MNATAEIITRRFLQVRRRPPLRLDEVAALVTEDATYVHDGFEAVGPAQIAEALHDLYVGRGGRMSVIGYQVLTPRTTQGHWHLIRGDEVVEGIDTYDVHEGRISRIGVQARSLALVA